MQEKCVQANKFVEAELCKQRIEKFKAKEKDKTYEALLKLQQEEKDQLDIEKKEELDKFNEDWDKQYFELRDKFEATEIKMREEHLEQMNKTKERVEIEIANSVPKPSSEAINLNAILENLIKQKEFQQAHDIQIQLTNVVKADQERISKENEKKIITELEIMKEEFKAIENNFKLKMKLKFDEYKRNRALDYDNLVQKYKNRINEKENAHKIALAAFPKNYKNKTVNTTPLNKTGSKISNILKEEDS